MSVFTGEIVADYTMPAPILYFKNTDEGLFKAYKEDLLSLMQKYEKQLRSRNGESNGPLNTSNAG